MLNKYCHCQISRSLSVAVWAIHAAELDLQQVDGFEVLEGVFPDALDLVGVEEEKLE